MIRSLILLLCVLGLSPAAAAADLSVSYSDWLIRGSSVTLRIELPAAEARMTMAPELPMTQEGIAKYVAAHVGVRSAGGACPALDQGFDLGKIDPLAKISDLYSFEVLFACPDSAGITLENSILFERLTSHLDFAQIDVGGRKLEKLFTRKRQAIPIDAATGGDGVLTLLPIGFDHVRRDWYHIFFLVGLLALVSSRRDLLLCAAGLSGGYILSGFVALSGVVSPDVMAAEALSGLAILMLAIEIVLRQTRRPLLIAIAAFVALATVATVPLWERHWLVATMLLGGGLFAGSYALLADRKPGARFLYWGPTALFGFMDGLSFLPPLTATRAELGGLSAMLAGFDLGAFLAQAAVLVALFLMLRAARFLRLDGFRPFLQEIATASLCAISLFWLARDYWQ